MAAESPPTDLTAAAQLLTEQLDALLVQRDAPSPMALPDPNSEGGQVPGIAARRRWMRTVGEKLDLLSARKCLPHDACLHQI